MDFGIIEKLAKCVVRPPKSHYTLDELGPTSFYLKNRCYERQDFTVTNNRGLELQCSFFKDKFSPIARETIIFLHANSSSRLTTKNYVDIFLPYFDLLGFDFAGCGQSEGQFITLGYNQKQDVYSVISKARERFGVKDIILWGRSMGAATAILYAAKYGGVKAIISDNSFNDLQELVNQLSDQYIPILPSFLVDTIINSIQEYIEQNIWKKQITQFNIRKLKPIKAIQKVTCPIFFIGSLQDSFVNVRHTKRLHTKAKSQKKLQLVSGDHNDLRSDALKQKILKFLIDLNIVASLKNSLKERTNIFKTTKRQNKEELLEDIQIKSPSKDIRSPLTLDYIMNYRQPRWKQINQPILHQSPNYEQNQILQSYYAQKLKRQMPKPSNNDREQSRQKRRKIFEGIDFINKRLSEKST